MDFAERGRDRGSSEDARTELDDAFWWEREWGKVEREEAVALGWSDYYKFHVRNEYVLFRELKKAFSAFEKRALARFDEAVSRLLGLKALPEGFSLDPFVPIAEQEAEYLTRRFRRLFEEIFERSAKRAIRSFHLGYSFDLQHEEAQRFVDEKLYKFADEICETTINQLKNQLKLGFEEGESIEQLRLRIQQVFAGTVRGTAPRARLIARTETTALTNGGTYHAFIQSGQVAEYRWMSAADERVRPTHREADGQVRPLGTPFVVGGYKMLFPGDGSLGAHVKEIANCRCTIVLESFLKLPVPEEAVPPGTGYIVTEVHESLYREEIERLESLLEESEAELAESWKLETTGGGPTVQEMKEKLGELFWRIDEMADQGRIRIEELSQEQLEYLWYFLPLAREPIDEMLGRFQRLQKYRRMREAAEKSLEGRYNNVGRFRELFREFKEKRDFADPERKEEFFKASESVGVFLSREELEEAKEVFIEEIFKKNFKFRPRTKFSSKEKSQVVEALKQLPLKLLSRIYESAEGWPKIVIHVLPGPGRASASGTNVALFTEDSTIGSTLLHELTHVFSTRYAIDPEELRRTGRSIEFSDDVVDPLGEGKRFLPWSNTEFAKREAERLGTRVAEAYRAKSWGIIRRYSNGDGEYEAGRWIDTYQGRIYTLGGKRYKGLEYLSTGAIAFFSDKVGGEEVSKLYFEVKDALSLLFREDEDLFNIFVDLFSE